jgi:hypothetical protein
MTKPYLPTWATAKEAADWLKAETGQEWPLSRLIETGADMGVWIDCPDDVTPQQLEHVFLGRRAGFMAVMNYTTDRERLAAGHDIGTLTMFERPDGQPVRITPAYRFAAHQVRFGSDGLRAIAAAMKDGDSLEDKRRQILQALPAVGNTFAAILALHGGTDPLAAASFEQAPQMIDLPAATPAAGADAPPVETARARRARLLEWHEYEVLASGERGALARVTAREQARRPTADRSNIGKEIKKAEAERDAAKRAGLFSGLGK